MGKRGPAPKPTNIKKFEGNPGRRKLNEQEPQFEVDGGDCPEWLSREAAEEWFRVVPQLKALDLLTRVDRGALAAYCSAFASFQRAEAMIAKAGDITKQGTQIIPNPYYSIRNRSMELMNRFAQQFGFTPASRTGVQAPKVEAKAQGKARFFKQA